MPDMTIDDLCLEFQTFIKCHLVGRPDSEYIADYLLEWLTADKGDGAAVAVNGDYVLYLQAVVAIIDNCLRDPRFLAYEGGETGPRLRPIRGVVNPERSRPVFVNQHFFQGIVFDLLAQGR